jgi:hypothetical protein
MATKVVDDIDIPALVWPIGSHATIYEQWRSAERPREIAYTWVVKSHPFYIH